LLMTGADLSEAPLVEMEELRERTSALAS